MEVTTLSNEAIQAQLNKIVSSATFHGAARANALLQYLVGQTLAGKAATLKEFTIGVDALGRSAAFDPRTDAIARVEASRLRTRLDLYYAREGAMDRVLITLPRGGYVPAFESRAAVAKALAGSDVKAAAMKELPQNAAVTGLSGRLPLMLAAFVLLVIFAVSGLYWSFNSTPPPHAIAVLPFASDTETEYLADGLTENLINTLSRLSELRVTSRSVAFSLKNRDTDPALVGTRLNVGTVVTGRVALREGVFTVQVEMVDTATGTQLWGERYERNFSDVLAVQEDIGAQIARNLSLRLSGDEQRQLAKRYTSSAEAYQLYLQGLFLSSKPTREGIEKAVSYYQQAIAKDPQFALAYVNLATCFELQSAEAGPGTLLQEAKNAVIQAIRIDNTLAEAHAELGFLKWIHELDLPGAESELELALELDPESAVAHFDYSRVLAENGRFEEALREANQAIALDPLSMQTRKRLPYVLLLARRYDEAIVEYQKLIELAPDFVQTQRELGLAYEQKRMLQPALQQFQKVSDMPENYASTMARADIAHLYAVSGQRAEAQQILAELLEQAGHSYVSAYDIAVVYAGLDETAQAFGWLAKAVEQRPFFIGWLNVDPRLDGLRTDPRFDDLL